MTHRELIAGCQRGERSSQAALYTEFSSQAYGTCLKYARNQKEAQDVLQETFITVFEKIDQVRQVDSIGGWIRRIARNKALEAYRGTAVYPLRDDYDPVQVDEEVYNGPRMDYLLSLVQALPDRYRAVFSLYVLDGHNHKEIGELLDISPGTSKSNLARARAVLQDRLNKDQGIPQAGNN